MTRKTRWSILEIDLPYYACRSHRASQTSETATSLPMIGAIARRGELNARRLQPDFQQMRISVPSSFPF